MKRKTNWYRNKPSLRAPNARCDNHNLMMLRWQNNVCIEIIKIIDNNEQMKTIKPRESMKFSFVIQDFTNTNEIPISRRACYEKEREQDSERRVKQKMKRVRQTKTTWMNLEISDATTGPKYVEHVKNCGYPRNPRARQGSQIPNSYFDLIFGSHVPF
jgi:hypothetical protein